MHPAQRQIARSDARFRVVAAGRRFGKSKLAALLCVVTALEQGRAWWVAPSYPIASVGWRDIRRLARQIPGHKIREVDRLIELPGGGAIQVRSADNPDSLRGDGLDLAVLDECAFIREDAWLEALRPALSDRKGKALFISTPKGRNWFWHAWRRGQDGGEWASFRFPTAANPLIDAAEIEAARLGLPERTFAQEYLAEFLESDGAVFRRVTDAATAGPKDAAEDGHQYIFGVDWGRTGDFTVITVLDATERRVVALDRFNQIDFAIQTNRLRALSERFQPDAIVAEQNSIGLPLVEQLYRDGLPVQPFQTTNATKAAIIDGLALALERGELAIPDDPVLIGELLAYESDRLPSGLMRYGAPSGQHDDCVMSLALAWYGASTSGPLLLGDFAA